MNAQMSACVLRAPLAFFHTNPAGRILNRFSKDQGAVDDLLPQVLFDALQSIFQIFGARPRGKPSAPPQMQPSLLRVACSAAPDVMRQH